jgi:hypothetical protein
MRRERLDDLARVARRGVDHRRSEQGVDHAAILVTALPRLRRPVEPCPAAREQLRHGVQHVAGDARVAGVAQPVGAGDSVRLSERCEGRNFSLSERAFGIEPGAG